MEQNNRSHTAQLIVLSGESGSGKDTLAEQVLSYKSNFQLYAFANPLKDMAIEVGWNGIKDERGRTFLQSLGDVIRSYNSSYFIDKAKQVWQIAKNNNLSLIITDCRKIDEADWTIQQGGLLIRIERPHNPSGLKGEQKKHNTERELDNYKFPFKIINDGTIEELVDKFYSIIEKK